ncbi:MAG: APC family permease [Verrucomicrobiota bacterium]
MSDRNSANPAELKRTLGFAGVLGQSIAGESPTATPALNIALVFAAVGSGTWLVFLISTLAILLVSLNIAPLARSGSAAGSLSDFVGRGLGETWRVITGWILLLTYLSTAVAVLSACVGYLASLLGALGAVLPQVLLVGLAGVIASILALRNVRVSTGLMLGFELLSITLVLLLCAAILFRLGVTADFSQLRLEGITYKGVSGTLLIGILSFAGFETAAVLGDEAKDPLRSIPRALFATPILTGIFFVLSSYVIVLGLNHYGVNVSTTETPLDVLSERLKRPGLGILISFGATISLFGCTIATLLATSRIAFSLARGKALPSLLAVVSPRHFIPRNAMLPGVALVMATAISFSAFAKPMDIYDWFGTFATFGFVTAYLLTCVSMPLVLARQGTLRPTHIAASIAAIVVLSYVLFTTVYPVPPAPLNILPWLFLGLLGAGASTSIWARSRQSFQRDSG